MIEYLIESTICSAILYLCFLAFFRRSRNYIVNRIILLFSVLFSLLAPLLNFSPNSSLVQEVIGSDAVSTTISNLSIVSNQTIEATRALSDDWSLIPLLLYAIVTVFLLGKFCYNLYSFIAEKIVVEKMIHQGYKLALVNMKLSPFSFFRTVYLNKEGFDNGEIDQELLLHEFGHINQLHSIDIIFIEFIQVFYWFNPFVYLFKKLIKTNHEYLADEYVVNSGVNKTEYSHKLINYTIRDKTLNLASGFNYSLIKNRLIMLSKYDQKGSIFYRLSMFLFIIATLFVSTAFSSVENLELGIKNDKNSGFFYADNLIWSGENHKVYLKGKVDIKACTNDLRGKGSFSFLGEVHLLMFNGKKATLNTTMDVSGKKCLVKVLSIEAAQEKYGAEGNLGAVEIRTVK